MTVDIDEGRKAEEQPGSVAQLQATLNVIPAHTWYAAPSGGLTFVNKRTADYLGLPKDHPLRFGIDTGAQWDAHIPLLHPDDREESRKAWSTCLRTGEAAEFNQRVRNAQGEYRWFLSRVEPLRASDGTLLQWVGVNVDIEELKSTEQALRESEYKLRQIIDTIPSHLWSADPDGEPTQLSQRMLDYSGMRFEEFKHRGWEAYVHPDDFPETAQAFYHAIQTGTPYQGVMRLRQADGEFRWHDARCEPLRDRQGRIVQWYGLSVEIDEAKKAENRLRRSEAYLAEAERLNHSGGWAVNRKGERKIVYWSEESYRIFGFDALQGMPTRDRVWQQIHPDDRSRLREEADAALREKRDYVAAFRILLPDGTIKYLESNARHLFSAGGELLEVIGTFVDVTERRRAEQTLRESEARLAETQRELQQMIDTIPILVVCYSTDARRDFVNAAWKQYTGLSDEAALGTDWSIVAHPDDFAAGEKMWRDTLAKGEPVHTEVRFRRADGQYRWFAVDRVALRDDSGKVIKWYGTAYDIEERKRAEQALRESEAKFRDFAETASDWFCEMGPDYKFTLLSENAFGSGAADRIGTACWDHALDLETEPEKWRLLQETVFARKPFRDFVYRGMSSDGSAMYVRASAKPLFDPSGEFRGYRGTCTDVTALRTIEAEARNNERRYREAQLELAHANRVATTGQLTASITHEVNQPLTAAVTYALAARRWLGAEPPNFRETDDALALVVKEGKRAGEVVGRIRALIKKAPPRKDTVAINDAIIEVIALTRTEATHNSVSVRMQLAEDLPPVLGDRVQLQQVLLNLILNAIEAMRETGEAERELLISTRHEPDGVSVEVRDSGPGFAPAALERVFEAFYTTKSGGLGLGLSICRSIIEAHDGRLWARPNAPRGAIFGFIAPAHPAVGRLANE